MDVSKELALRAQAVDNIIDGYLPAEEGYQKTVLEAMNYSIRVGGKRLRPVLMNEVFKLFGGTGESVEPFMAAMEMIHTYSLVHDDLPAMDNDLLRRGKPTTHAVYGECMGILAGDALLNYAFETAVLAFDVDGDNWAQIAKALRVLSKKAGIFGMIGGQVVDIESERNFSISRDKIDFIYKLKTGALIEASMMIGAILAGASQTDVDIVEQIATKIGLAFQIQDDILDIVGDEATLGKPIGSDEKNQKSTYVAFEGLDKAKLDVKKLTDEAVELLDGLNNNDPFLKELLNYLVYRNN